MFRCCGRDLLFGEECPLCEPGKPGTWVFVTPRQPKAEPMTAEEVVEFEKTWAAIT